LALAEGLTAFEDQKQIVLKHNNISDIGAIPLIKVFTAALIVLDLS